MSKRTEIVNIDALAIVFLIETVAFITLLIVLNMSWMYAIPIALLSIIVLQIPIMIVSLHVYNVSYNFAYRESTSIEEKIKEVQNFDIASNTVMTIIWPLTLIASLFLIYKGIIDRLFHH